MATGDKNWVIKAVDPHAVWASRTATVREIKYQMTMLKTEGQIEPLTCIRESTGQLILRDEVDDWLYGSAQLVAARELEWDTVLVTYKEEEEKE